MMTAPNVTVTMVTCVTVTMVTCVTVTMVTCVPACSHGNPSNLVMVTLANDRCHCNIGKPCDCNHGK